MSNEKLRMDAYYYGFAETGQAEIDLILSAVACAGKSFHHTDQWNDEDSPWPGHTGNSPTEWITNAASSAAQEMVRLKAENEALRTGQAIKRLSGDEVREALNGAYYQARDTGSDGEQCRAGVLAVIEAAMAKESK